MPTFSRSVRESLKRTTHAIFSLGQSLGVDILPRHFYSEIPDLRELHKSDYWKAHRSMYGIQGAAIEEQLQCARACVDQSIQAVLQQEKVHAKACAENGAVGYGPIEAEFLFCFISHFKPRKIIQIGAGVSTSVILQAGRLAGFKPDILCIDPYPTEYLKSTAAKGDIRLLEKKCQQVDLSVLTDLNAGDLLFIDSTHTVKAGSEVNQLILEILPRLAKGCLVHFHDICLPYDYTASILKTTFFHNETALLYAFLLNNARYRITTSLSMLHYAAPAELKKILPDYQPVSAAHGMYDAMTSGHFPSATYLEVIA